MVWQDGEWIDTPADAWAGPQPNARPWWQRKVSDTPRLPGESLADWGYRAGGYDADQVPRYRALEADEQRRVLASGTNPTGPSELETLIGSLYPAAADIAQATQPGLAQQVLAKAGLDPATGRQVRAAYGTASDTPLIDADDRALAYPGSPAWERFRGERERQQDLQAERERAAYDERQRLLESSGLTDEEWDRVFRGLE